MRLNQRFLKYFVCDMNPHFWSVAKACFPKAKIVADKYHVVRQAVWAMERVRKEEQKKLSKRFRIYFKRSRYLLNKPKETLTEDEMNRLALMFEIAPRLADAYRVKNEVSTAEPVCLVLYQTAVLGTVRRSSMTGSAMRHTAAAMSARRRMAVVSMTIWRIPCPSRTSTAIFGSGAAA